MLLVKPIPSHGLNQNLSTRSHHLKLSTTRHIRLVMPLGELHCADGDDPGGSAGAIRNGKNELANIDSREREGGTWK